MASLSLHRPRNVGWRRAAGLLYGDWGTSKAYVIGVAFSGMATMAGAAEYRALPSILGVCALTALVAYNYVIICRHFPDGGGVYSAARTQSRFLAVLGPDVPAGYAPGTLTILECAIDRWADLMPGENRILRVLAP